MSEHDFGLSAGRRRHQRASPLWVVAAIALPAFAALIVALPSVTPIFHLGERMGGRLGGYVAEAFVGLPVGGAIAAIIWFQVNWSRFERLPKYLGLVFIGWTVGMVAGTLLTLDLDNTDRNGPPPSGVPIQQAYWDARVAEVNAYQHALNTDIAALAHVDAASAGARLQQMRARLVAARSANTGEAAQRLRALEALGHNEMQRRALAVEFNEDIHAGEAMMTELWTRQAQRLGDVEQAVAAGRRGPLVSYRTELAIWDATAQLNGMLNRLRSRPGAVPDTASFETEVPGGSR